MQTEKDAEIVGWVGRLGAAGAEHVMARFEMGRSWAYERLGQLVADRLLEQRMVLFRKPGVYAATAAGLRWRGLERLGVHQVRPGGYEHAWEVAQAAVALHQGLPGLAGAERAGDPRARARRGRAAGLRTGGGAAGWPPGAASAGSRAAFATGAAAGGGGRAVGEGAGAAGGDLPWLGEGAARRWRVLPRDARRRRAL